MTLTIYKPEGVHTKDNPCDCGNCSKYPEFFHAMPYKLNINFYKDMAEAIAIRDEFYPDGVIKLGDTSASGAYFFREDGSKVTYSYNEDKWREEDGSLHSKN